MRKFPNVDLYLYMAHICIMDVSFVRLACTITVFWRTRRGKVEKINKYNAIERKNLPEIYNWNVMLQKGRITSCRSKRLRYKNYGMSLPSSQTPMYNGILRLAYSYIIFSLVRVLSRFLCWYYAQGRSVKRFRNRLFVTKLKYLSRAKISVLVIFQSFIFRIKIRYHKNPFMYLHFKVKRLFCAVQFHPTVFISLFAERILKIP